MKFFIVVYNTETGYVEQTLEFPDVASANRNLDLEKNNFTDKKYEITLMTDTSLESLKKNWRRWRWPETPTINTKKDREIDETERILKEKTRQFEVWCKNIGYWPE